MSASLRLAVLGDPVAHSRSPALHRAGAAALGLACESRAIRTSAAGLAATLDALAAEGVRGVNLTHPLKEAALGCGGAITPRASRARAVNTVTLGPGPRAGDSTDGAGFVDWLGWLGVAPGARVVFLGAGGAARSAALAAVAAGFGVALLARDPGRVAESWPLADRPPLIAWREPDLGAALAGAHVVVNATPLGGDAAPVPAEHLADGTRVLDMTYGDVPARWLVAARARGLEAHDGLGLLVGQARHSLAHWLGREVPLAPLAEAAGWRR